jgi:hypothetical protein
VLLGAASAFILVVTVPVGLLTSVGLDRAVSLGFYGLGVLLVILGFLGGSRGPFRSEHDFAHGSALRSQRRLRRATLDELHESMNGAAIVIGIGLVLLALGVIIDSRYTLL